LKGLQRIIKWFTKIINNMMEYKKIGENDKVIFYTNSFCKDWGDGYRMIIADNVENKGQDRGEKKREPLN